MFNDPSQEFVSIGHRPVVVKRAVISSKGRGSSALYFVKCFVIGQ